MCSFSALRSFGFRNEFYMYDLRCRRRTQSAASGPPATGPDHPGALQGGHPARWGGGAPPLDSTGCQIHAPPLGSPMDSQLHVRCSLKKVQKDVCARACTAALQLCALCCGPPPMPGCSLHLQEAQLAAAGASDAVALPSGGLTGGAAAGSPAPAAVPQDGQPAAAQPAPTRIRIKLGGRSGSGGADGGTPLAAPSPPGAATALAGGARSALGASDAAAAPAVTAPAAEPAAVTAPTAATPASGAAASPPASPASTAGADAGGKAAWSAPASSSLQQPQQGGAGIAVPPDVGGPAAAAALQLPDGRVLVSREPFASAAPAAVGIEAGTGSTSQLPGAAAGPDPVVCPTGDVTDAPIPAAAAGMAPEKPPTPPLPPPPGATPLGPASHVAVTAAAGPPARAGSGAPTTAREVNSAAPVPPHGPRPMDENA